MSTMSTSFIREREIMQIGRMQTSSTTTVSSGTAIQEASEP